MCFPLHSAPPLPSSMLRIHLSHGQVVDGIDLLMLVGHPDLGPAGAPNLGWAVHWHVMDASPASPGGGTAGGYEDDAEEAQHAAASEEEGASVPRRRQVCMSLSRREDPSESDSGNDDGDDDNEA